MNAMPGKILVVDDVPKNVKLLEDLLTVKGYPVVTAASGAEALARVASEHPSLLLLDVMMPGMNGYEVCRSIRSDPAHAVLPIVLVTALDANEEKIKGLEAGADDFLTKPINQAELLARVRSLLRIKSLYDKVEQQASQLAAWNAQLEQRVQEQLQQMERLRVLKRFLTPKVADLILAGGAEDPLKSHRQEVTVAFVDLRGFTAFTETTDPEEVMAVLHDYHAEAGRLIVKFEGTLERFLGDGIMIVFNDPLTVPDHELQAVRMAVAMRSVFAELGAVWRKKGHDLNYGIGIAQGYATIGKIGFEGRWDYSSIGPVCNLAARLCSEAKGGQILVPQRVFAKLEPQVRVESVGELSLKGIQRPVTAYNILGLRV